MRINLASTLRYITTSAFSVLLFLFLVAYTHHSFTSYQQTQEQIHHIQRTGDIILYYDEILTMSARMGAVTGDKAWQERYDKHAPLLDAAIERANRLVDVSRSPLDKTKQANDALKAMESKAFALINADRKEEALQLLLDDSYLNNKKIYAQSLSEMMQIFKNSKDSLSGKRNTNITFAAIISMATFSLIIFNIIATFRKLRRDNALLAKQLNIIDRYVISSSTDPSGVITKASDAFCNISGYSREELIGRQHNIIRHADVPKETYETLWKTIKSGKRWHGELKNRKKDGSFYWVDATVEPKCDSDGHIIGYDALRFDITGKKKVEELALTDALTDLFNRRHFDDFFPREFKRASRDKQPLSLLILDIDHFKEYNDTYGHQQGDRALKAVACVIKNALYRSSDTAFRIGGEEFCIILINTPPAGAKEVAQKIISNISRLEIEHKKSSAGSYLSISVGINSLTPDAYTSVSDMMEKADRNLYKAKQKGRNRYVCEEDD